VPFLSAIASQAIRTISEHGLESDTPVRPGALVTERAMDLLGLVHGLSSNPMITLCSALWDLATEVLDHRGSMMDRRTVKQPTPNITRADGCGSLITKGIDSAAASQQIPKVIHRSPDVCVLWKPPHWTVSIGSAEEDGNEELSSMLEDGNNNSSLGQPLQMWVAQELGVHFAINTDAKAQYGLLHRLDRETSGALLCATSYRGYHLAHLQFAARRVLKEYICLCHGWMPLQPCVVQSPLAVVSIGPNAKRSVVSSTGKPSCTEVCSVGHLFGPKHACFSIISVKLHTGRMHQIRAHLSAAGHSLVGDPSYGGQRLPWCRRVFLHAYHLQICVAETHISVKTSLPCDLIEVLAQMTPASKASSQMVRLLTSVHQVSQLPLKHSS